ncbi:MAG TPA: gamma-glutamyl-gamma-aminobutyrate hydrolase family protein [Bacteroidales bacterium]|nr:gamma-glutamyl-gamma-aminobutyrate hydrolase family protein [Bacteroidales bacterium]
MKRLYPSLFLLIALVFLMPSCNQHGIHQKPLVIAITKERKIEGKKYGEWLGRQDSTLRFIYLSEVAFENLADSLALADGILFTGGADIHPANYGKASDTIRCGAIDTIRDRYELEAFRIAQRLKMPVLGICRGLQMINVAMGGTLVIDLPQDKGTAELHRVGSEDWAEHPVTLIPGSRIASLVKTPIVMVASNHHQGIEQLAPALSASATSPDMLIEAIENQPNTSPWIMAVQWHPEWMAHDDELSGKIAVSFLKEAKSFSNKKR